MERPANSDRNIASVEEQLHYEIHVLKAAIAKLEHGGDIAAKQWIYPIY